MKKHYKDLIVWQKSIALVTAVYQATHSFPKEEMFGLTSQIRRAAISVPSNIAEGQGRLTKGEFLQFLGQAKGSLLEVETQVVIAQNLNFLAAQEAERLLQQVAEVGRLLNGLLIALRHPKPATNN